MISQEEVRELKENNPDISISDDGVFAHGSIVDGKVFLIAPQRDVLEELIEHQRAGGRAREHGFRKFKVLRTPLFRLTWR